MIDVCLDYGPSFTHSKSSTFDENSEKNKNQPQKLLEAYKTKKTLFRVWKLEPWKKSKLSLSSYQKQKSMLTPDWSSIIPSDLCVIDS